MQEENPFEVDLRIQRNPQEAVLEDQGRMTKNAKIGGQAGKGIPNRIDRCRYGKDRKIQQVHRRIPKYDESEAEIRVAEAWRRYLL